MTRQKIPSSETSEPLGGNDSFWKREREDHKNHKEANGRRLYQGLTFFGLREELFPLIMVVAAALGNENDIPICRGLPSMGLSALEGRPSFSLVLFALSRELRRLLRDSGNFPSDSPDPNHIHRKMESLTSPHFMQSWGRWSQTKTQRGIGRPPERFQTIGPVLQVRAPLLPLPPPPPEESHESGFGARGASGDHSTLGSQGGRIHPASPADPTIFHNNAAMGQTILDPPQQALRTKHHNHHNVLVDSPIGVFGHLPNHPSEPATAEGSGWPRWTMAPRLFYYFQGTILPKGEPDTLFVRRGDPSSPRRTTRTTTSPGSPHRPNRTNLLRTSGRLFSSSLFLDHRGQSRPFGRRPEPDLLCRHRRLHHTSRSSSRNSERRDARRNRPKHHRTSTQCIDTFRQDQPFVDNNNNNSNHNNITQKRHQRCCHW